MNKLPKVNYIGNKEKLTSWIIENVPSDVKSIFDAFSGGCSVGYFAKIKGYEVITNDILNINYLLAKALIENKNVTLDENDIKIIFEGNPIEGFMFNNYAEVFYFENECKELDLYIHNIKNKISDQYKQALAIALLRRAMIRKMPYSRFNIKWDKIVQLRDEEYSYLKYKRKRSYHNESFKHHFLANLSDYNSAIFDNGKNNKSYNENIFDIVNKIEADLIYLDPPYTGTMNNYHGFYGMLDEFIEGKKVMPFDDNFIDKKEVEEIFDRLFSNLKNYKYWMLSYNNKSYPTKEILINIISKYSNEIKVIEKQHTYKITGKENKNNNMEYLFLIKNSNHDYFTCKK